MKDIVCISWWRSLLKDNKVAAKLCGLVILLVLSFMLLHHRSSDISPDFENTWDNSSSPLTTTSSNIIQENANHIPKQEKCNLFVGDWMPYEGKPPYNKSCRFITDHQNCIKNGRPDLQYLQWRWQPRACHLPRFDPLKFLETMRNKSWAFIGDSISRNHIQSVLCMLSEVEEATLVHHDEGYKSQKWLLPSYNLTLSVIWSPFLARAIIPANIYESSPSEVEVHLDKLDPIWTNEYKRWDYMIFSAGKWYSRSSIYYENGTILGCHYCPQRNLTELGFDSAYRRVIRGVLDYIIESNHTGEVFYRTTSPDHFEGAEWFNGGVCERNGPAKEGEFELSFLDRILRDIEIEEVGNAYVRGYENGMKNYKVRVLDVNPMSLLRPDGHPGVYRFYHPFMNDSNAKVVSDCLHWCLPGPIDTWNDVLMEMIVNG